MQRGLLPTALVAVAFGATAAAAADPNPFIGHWTQGVLETCAPGYASDVLSIEVGEKKIEMFELGCDIQSIRKISKLADSGYRLRLLCKGASPSHFIDTQFNLLKKSPLHDAMLVRADQTTGIVFTYQRCP